MHGRLKVKTTAEQEEEKRKERQEQANAYQAATEKAFAKRKNGQLDDEALLLTTQLLVVNPDFYTIWNFRREIILAKKKELELSKNEPDEKVDDKEDGKENASVKLFENELQLTITCLMKNPKSYNSWHHRLWALLNIPIPDTDRELMLCGKMLDVDERNFHCWDYRTKICGLIKMSVEEELKFTLEKIRQNFSNFSSWYYRSCLFTHAFQSGQSILAQVWKDEYEMVQNALFTDPNDQSPWFYHKWLTSTNYGQDITSFNDKNDNLVTIKKVVINLIYSKLIIQLSRPVKDISVLVSINDKQITDLQWKSFEEPSLLWYCCLNFSAKICSLHLSLLPLNQENSGHMKSLVCNIDSNTGDNQIIVWSKTNSEMKQTKLEETYLSSLKSLQELEPENKWVNLTLFHLDCDLEEKIKILDKLRTIDPLRTNYYNDQRSRIVMERVVENSSASNNVSIINMCLTNIFHFNKLIHIQYLNVSCNNLTSLSKALNSLVCLEILLADDNRISSISKELKLEHLKILSLKNNCIKSIDCLNLRNFVNLEELILSGNPVLSLINDQQNLLNNEKTKVMTGDYSVIFNELNYKTYAKVVTNFIT